MVSINLWGRVAEIGLKLKTMSTNNLAEAEDLKKENEYLKQELALREKKYQSLYNEIQLKESQEPLTDSQYEISYKQLGKTFKNFLLTFFTENIFIEKVNEIFINIAHEKFFDNVYQLSQLIKPKIYFEFISAHQDQLAHLLSYELIKNIADINNVHSETFYEDYSSEESMNILNEVFGELLKEIITRKASEKELQMKIADLIQKNKETENKFTLLNQNIQTMQLDCQEAMKKEKKVEDVNSYLTKERDTLQNLNESLSLQIKTMELTLNNNITDLKTLNEKFIVSNEKYEVMKREKENSESKAISLNQEVNKLKEEIKSLQTDIELFSETNNEINDKNAMISQKDTEINNLMSSYAFLEKSSMKLIKSKEEELDTYKNKIFSMSRELTELKEAIENKNQYETIESIYLSKIETLENQVIALEKTSEQLLQKEIEMKKDEEDLIKKVQNDLKNTEFLIDKRVISSVLVNYFDKNNNEKIKESLLETLSNIMQYSNDDRKKMGLKPISIPKKDSDHSDRLKDIGDGLYNFIMNS